jgi:hypothetical protein
LIPNEGIQIKEREEGGKRQRGSHTKRGNARFWTRGKFGELNMPDRHWNSSVGIEMPCVAMC